VKRSLAVILVASVLASASGCVRRERTEPGGQSLGDPPPVATSDTPARSFDGRVLTADGRVRTYHLHVPGGLSEHALPLVIALHGGTGSGDQFRRNSGLDELADERGFLVVYPDGVGVGPTEALRTWNGGYCCGRAARDGVDDVGFVRELIDAIAAEFPIDPQRVFAVGHSNGGILAYRLACELSDRVAAVALQAGSLGVEGCDPEHPVSLLHLHGAADTNHPIDGGQGGTSISGVDFHSARTSVRDFAAADGCPGTPIVEVDSVNRDLTISTWTPCAGGSEVRFVEVAGAPHAWMGHSSVAPWLTGEPYPDLDASEVVVDFVLAHPRQG